MSIDRDASSALTRFTVYSPSLEPAPELRVSASVSEPNAKAAEPSERKLTSIVVTDVVGYSRLTAADEEGTIARLRELRS